MDGPPIRRGGGPLLAAGRDEHFSGKGEGDSRAQSQRISPNGITWTCLGSGGNIQDVLADAVGERGVRKIGR